MVKIILGTVPMLRNFKTLLLYSLVWGLTPVFLVTSFCFAIPGRETRQEEIKLGNTNIEQLLEDSDKLFAEEHPLDARAKLTEAIKIAPEDYRAYLKLGQYYLFDVSHFKLAYRFIKTAQNKFEKQYSIDGEVSQENRPQDAIILYMLSEAELNLDRYKDSLKTLDKFESKYWMDWLPGSKAWVLMKLKRVDEAIKVAKEGLIKGAEPRRTWNILGILLSMQGDRETSLEAFKQAITAEMLTTGMASTPLNNAGEVYRELYRDADAESAWLMALKMSDGCDHILPSLNLAHAYIEQLRLFQAERALKDFETCFSQRSEREDSEHRTLLALARGKIALRKNDLEQAEKLFNTALADQQWFGKIGTNENDVKLASLTATAELNDAKISAIKDKAYYSLKEKLTSYLQIPILKFKSWWLRRLARKLAVNEMDNFEDLYIRNTDSMLEYPSLGDLTAGFAPESLVSRINKLKLEDQRPEAHVQYQTYLAISYLKHGYYDKALEILKVTSKAFRPYERFQIAEALAYEIEATMSKKHFWQSTSDSEKQELNNLKKQLFSLLPSAIRFHDLKLPVRLLSGSSKISKKAEKHLLKTRFEIESENLNPKYQLTILEQNNELIIQLFDIEKNITISSKSEKITEVDKTFYALLNSFIIDVFAYKTDASPLPLPTNLSVIEN